MRQSLAEFIVHPANDPKTAYQLGVEPALRFTNTVGDVRDGAIFLWLGEDDRPAAAVQVFLHRNGNWYQEFSSLSTFPVSAEPVWKASSGVIFKPVPGAPKPSENPDMRLRQMKALLTDFSAEQDFPDDQRPVWEKLRLLTKPLARYGKPGKDVVDGALFAYVMTTDPEVYLMLEVRTGQNGPEWQYAFAVESMASVRGFWKGSEVWSLPLRQAWQDNRASYYIHNFGYDR